MVNMMGQYAKKKFSVEQVEVIYEDTNEKHLEPNIAFKTIEVDTHYINTLSSLNLSRLNLHLSRRANKSAAVENGGEIGDRE